MGLNIIVKCNGEGCKVEKKLPGPTLIKARAELRGEKWVVLRGNRTYCPLHVKEAEKPKKVKVTPAPKKAPAKKVVAKKQVAAKRTAKPGVTAKAPAKK